MKTRLLTIFGASVVGFVIILLAMTIILNDFKSVTIPSTSDHLSKVEACNLINGNWDSVHKTCDNIDTVSCIWLDGKYQECKSHEYICPLDNPDCTTTLSCISTCLFEQSFSANVEPVQKELENEISTDGMPKKIYISFPPSMEFNDFVGDKIPEFIEVQVAGQSETRSNAEFTKYNSLKSAVAGYNILEVFTNDKKGEEDIILGKKSVSSDSRTKDILYSQDYIWITKNTHREDVALDVYATIPLNDGYKLVDINKDVRNAPLREMIHMVDSEDNTIGISPLDIWFVTDDYSYTIRGHLTETQSINLANKILKLEN